MSLYVLYEHYCNFCGEMIHKESYLLEQSFGFEVPAPRANNFRTGMHNWDLCTTCVTPMREKLDEKIVELREAGLLNAPRTTQEIEERRNKWVG